MSEQEPRLSAIVAMTPERVIGKNGELPWHLPEDLQVFKKITTGHPIVMGRKTFESIGRPLPKRRNIVITRDREWSHEGVEVIHETNELSLLTKDEDQVFIIGGSEIYKAFLPLLDELYVSEVHQTYQGDTYFPEFESLFEQKEEIEEFIDFTLVRYNNKNC